jgi:hypothetical protein
MNFNTNTNLIKHTGNLIDPNLIALSIQKIDSSTFNLMAVMDVSTTSESKNLCEMDDFKKLLKISFLENDFIIMDTPIIEAFRDFKNKVGSLADIKTVRINVAIHLTEIGKLQNTFELNGATVCTMEDYCKANDAKFKLVYAMNKMTVVAEYIPLVYSN